MADNPTRCSWALNRSMSEGRMLLRARSPNTGRIRDLRCAVAWSRVLVRQSRVSNHCFVNSANVMRPAWWSRYWPRSRSVATLRANLSASVLR